MESFTEEAEVHVLSLKPGTEYSFSVCTVVELNGTKIESAPVTITHRTSELLFCPNQIIRPYAPAERTSMNINTDLGWFRLVLVWC